MSKAKPKAALTAEKEQKKPNPGGFVKGDPRINRAGRPQGALDFRTKWFAMIDKVAKSNNMTADEINEQLLMVGFKQAKAGNHSFWREINERLYGKVGDKLDITSLGKEINADDEKITRLAHEFGERLKELDE